MYQALYRKYRPSNFDEIAGQQVIVKTLKNAILNDIRSEDPECPDFEYICELLGVFVEDFRIYVVGNIFQMIPGEQIECYPKPYYEEVITFPFSYSLFKSLFFDNE